VPETPEQLFARVADALRMPAVETWDTFPFDGEMRPRALRPPEAREVPRHGADGADCHSCANPDDRYLWTNERWRLHAPDRPSGLPAGTGGGMAYRPGCDCGSAGSLSPV
jgi:hypothetical protein